MTVDESVVEIAGRGGARRVRFPSRVLLAPMEGVTDPAFRRLVLDLGGAGGACTEFARIGVAPIPEAVLRRSLGPLRADVPVAVQLMAPGVEHVAATVAHAERAGAAWIDLNFGCPVARVCGRGAGSALLDDPALLERIVAEAAGATELPVSAKIRTGTDDTSRLEEIVHAAAAGGAAMLTVHGRRRVDGWGRPADPEAVARAVDAWRRRATGPACGNGSVETPADAAAMRRETGCDLVMIGRGALANPFVFREIAGGPAAGARETAAFVLRYADAVSAPGRVKQLVRYLRAGGLFDAGEDERERLLRCDAAALRAHFAGLLGAAGALRPAHG